MDMSLEGRLRNTVLTPSNVLFTLYEGVFNSFHAIEDAPSGAREVSIRVERDPQYVTMRAGKDGAIVDAPVLNVHITDTGIGFTDDNVRSFKLSDTTYKIARGGKGVGRFMWLKAFTKVAVESVVEAGSKLVLRTFDFTAPQGVGNETEAEVKDLPRVTTVHLLGLRGDYQDSWPKRLDIVARKLAEHVLMYLLRGNPPLITLTDGEETIDVTSLFAEIATQADIRKFSVKGNDLEVKTFKLYRSDSPRNLLHLCAEEREVTNEPLSKVIPALSRKLVDGDGNSFVVSSFVNGAVLDQHLQSDRTDFSLPESTGEEVMPDIVTKEDIRRGAAEQIRAFLKPQLDAVGTEHLEHVRRFIETKAPEYRALYTHNPEALDAIPPGLNDEKLDAELHRITYKVESALREQGRSILEREKDDVAVAKEEIQDFIEKKNAFGTARLAAYIGHRKVVLEFLERRLGVNEQGKRPHESAIHELVFPLRNTSADVPLEQQNLWLIDERLSYHRYLASDLPLNQTEGVDIDGTKRPDLLIFQSPFAFVETDAPFPAVVIIEFKRAMRDDYTDDDNPIQQVYEYVEKIKSGRATDKTGMQFTVPPTTPFYCYVVANVTTKMKKWARFAALTETPDAGGFFGYNKDVGTYTEVISYQKLIADAKKRNRILFEKLALPERFT